MHPIHPIHPGKVLADELEELGMTAADLARAIHVPASRIWQIILDPAVAGDCMS
ncbi:MAG: hypothetical protein HQM01_15370 [Magnetococcales bacterium]|nr:hypothetical protein [Magnetococcales bacterium]